VIAIETPSEDWHDLFDQMPDTKNSHIRFRTGLFLVVCLQINTKQAQEGAPPPFFQGATKLLTSPKSAVGP
jgi:hypothetical protein